MEAPSNSQESWEFNSPPINPQLGTLQNNGGNTQTHALLASGPAINAGNNTGCPATDQRGYSRSGSCDMGAYEYNGVAGALSPLAVVEQGSFKSVSYHQPVAQQVVTTTTTYFIGAHYEVTGSQITKYYFAGASRIAMRKYTIPQLITVEYFLGDHLGSTNITTDSTGAKISEMRYKPWGETRYSWTSGQATTPAHSLPDYTYTGQYSNVDDFGLMFYNTGWYDPYLKYSSETQIPNLYCEPLRPVHRDCNT